MTTPKTAKMAPRRLRREAERNLKPGRIYTVRTTGSQLQDLGAGALVRADGTVLTLHFQMVVDGGDVLLLEFVQHHRVSGSMRMRLVRWLLGLA